MSMDLYVLKIVATSNFFAQTGWISQGIIQDGSHNFFRSQNYPNFWGLIKITGWPFGDWRYTWLWFCYWHEDTSVLCQKTFRVKFRPEKIPIQNPPRTKVFSHLIRRHPSSSVTWPMPPPSFGGQGAWHLIGTWLCWELLLLVIAVVAVVVVSFGSNKNHFLAKREAFQKNVR